MNFERHLQSVQNVTLSFAKMHTSQSPCKQEKNSDMLLQTVQT